MIKLSYKIESSDNMADIRVDKNIDELNDDIENLKEIISDIAYTDRELDAIEYSNSAGYIGMKVRDFISRNWHSLDPIIITKLNEMIDSNKVDGKKLASDITDFLNNYEKETKEKLNSKEEEKEDIQTEISESATKNLSEVGVIVKKEAVVPETNEDALTIAANANKVAGSIDPLPENVVLTEPDIKEILNGSNNDYALLNKVEEKIDEDKALIVKANINDSDSINYAAMLMSLAVTPDTNNLALYNSNLDLSITNTNEIDTIQVKCGKFPTSKKGIDINTINMLKNSLRHYDPAVDYSEKLPEDVSNTFNIVRNNLANTGNYKVIIKNKDGNIVVGFVLDSNCVTVRSELANNGVNLDNDVATVIVDSATLKHVNNKLNVEPKMADSLTNPVLNKKLGEYPINNEFENKEAGAVTPIFLTVVAIAEVILLGFYFTMIFR